MEVEKYKRGLAICQYFAKNFQKKRINFDKLYAEIQCEVYESEYWVKKMIKRFEQEGFISCKNYEKIQFFDEKITEKLVFLSKNPKNFQKKAKKC